MESQVIRPKGIDVCLIYARDSSEIRSAAQRTSHILGIGRQKAYQTVEIDPHPEENLSGLIGEDQIKEQARFRAEKLVYRYPMLDADMAFGIRTGVVPDVDDPAKRGYCVINVNNQRWVFGRFSVADDLYEMALGSPKILCHLQEDPVKHSTDGRYNTVSHFQTMILGAARKATPQGTEIKLE